MGEIYIKIMQILRTIKVMVHGKLFSLKEGLSSHFIPYSLQEVNNDFNITLGISMGLWSDDSVLILTKKLFF